MKPLLALLALALPLVADPLPHPRIGVNAAFLAQIDGLKAKSDPVYTNFAEWLTKKKAGWDGYTYVGSDEDGLLLGYIVTHDSALFDLAWAKIRPKVYAADGTLRQFYNADCSAGALYCDLHNSAYQGGGVTALVAKLYDYGYDRLNAQAKADIVQWLNNAADALTANVNATTYFRNDGAITVRGLNAIYLATLGENPKADSISAAWHGAWAEQLKALALMSEGGGMGEGNGYGALTMETIVDIANSTWYATGEDLFASSPAFKARLAYDAFSAYPKRLYDQNDPWYSHMNPTSEPSSIAGDSVRQSGWTSLAMQPLGRMLARHFPGTEEANLWNWVYAQPGTNAVADPWLALYTYAAPPALTKPTRLSWYAKGTGMIYVRQNWDSQDATWIASWAGTHWDLHQHLDQGAFDLFKRRDLLPSTGDYDASSVGPVHWLNYYSRTVATNNLLIGDPHEYMWGFWGWTGCAGAPYDSVHSLHPLADGSGSACIVNDGGQRTMMPHSMSIFGVADYLKAKSDYDVAKVLDFRDDGADVVQWTMDTTNAYTAASNITTIDDSGAAFTSPNKPKVAEVKRRLVYSRLADVLIVADTVESTDPAFEKSDVFHSLEKLDVLDGVKADMSPIGESLYVGAHMARITMDDMHPNSKGQITADYRLGYATAFLQSVFPVTGQMRVIGGREPADVAHQAQGQTNPAVLQDGHLHRHIKDFWVKDYSEGVLKDHVSANWPPIYPVNRADIMASMIGGYGVARVHVQPTVAARRDYFLTVIQPSLDPGAAPLPVTRIETADTFGVSFAAAGKTYTAVFPKQGDAPAVVTISDLKPAPVVPAQPPVPATTAPPAPATSGLTTQQLGDVVKALRSFADALSAIIAPKP